MKLFHPAPIGARRLKSNGHGSLVGVGYYCTWGTVCPNRPDHPQEDESPKVTLKPRPFTDKEGA
jgi:hypothetical protein